MEDDDGKARARRLREDIARITGKADKAPAVEPEKKSLHEQVQERMRDMNRKKDPNQE